MKTVLKTLYVLPLLTMLAACGGAKATSPAAETGASSASLGADSSGGADYHSIFYGAAWFQNANRRIQVCYEVDSSFQGPRAHLDSQLRGAFVQWKAYYQSKHGEVPGDSRLPALAFDADIIEATSGSCASHSPDLTVYFGGHNAQVDAVRKSNSVAFVYQTSSPIADSTWSKGYLWMTGDAWNLRDADSVNGLLLHELGHIFGCGHVAGTIMDENIASRMQETSAEGNDQLTKEAFARARHMMLTQIDQSRELTLGNTMDYTLVGTQCRDRNGTPCGFQNLFGQVLGHAPRGRLSLRLRNYTDGTLEMARAGYLTLSDEQGSRDLSFRLVDVVSFGSGSEVFKQVQLGEQDSHGAAPIYSSSLPAAEGRIWKIEATDPSTRRTYELELTWNSGNPNALLEASMDDDKNPMHAYGQMKVKFNEKGALGYDSMGTVYLNRTNAL